MQLLAILGASSLLFAALLTPFCRELFARHGLVDHPDPERKFHTLPIPNMGGIPIVFSYLASFGVLWIFSRRVVDNSVDFSLAARLAPAALIILAAGVLDDRFGLKPLQKLGLQIAGSIAAYSAGVRVEGIAWHHPPPYISFPATIAWLVVCTNAFNLIDGVDGLAAGVGLFATTTTLVAALMQHNLPLAMATAPLAGALLGFLRYNFSPATIFLGDSGSLLIGFLLGCFGALWSQKSATLLGMTAPVMVLSVPLLDVFLSVHRRIRGHQPIFLGDRGHIHHRLLALGFSPKRAVLVLYAVCALGAAFSIFQSAADRYASAGVLGFCCFTLAAIHRLRSSEVHRMRQEMRNSLNIARDAETPVITMIEP